MRRIGRRESSRTKCSCTPDTTGLRLALPLPVASRRSLDSLTRFDLQDTLLDAWEQNRKIVVMVTHDVDEALYLADRLVLMTDGPEARVGEILSLPFARPRERHAVLEHPEYYNYRRRVIDFLEHHAKHALVNRR